VLRRVLTRLATGALTLLLVTLLVFGLIQLAPGSPLETSDDGLTPLSIADRAALEAYYGFDRPLRVQYASWLGKLLRGDLGTSIRDRRPVVDKIAERLPVTLTLNAPTAGAQPPPISCTQSRFSGPLCCSNACLPCDLAGCRCTAAGA